MNSAAPWRIRPIDAFSKCLRRYKADKSVLANYRRLVEGLARSDNPSSMGIPKKGKYSGCLGTHITKSVVLVYRIDYDARKIDLLGIGDHKTVYGRDG